MKFSLFSKVLAPSRWLQNEGTHSPESAKTAETAVKTRTRRRLLATSLLRAAIGAGLAASSLLVVGCGASETSHQNGNAHGREKEALTLGTPDAPRYAKRFNAEQIAATFTDEVKDGVPQNRNPIFEFYTQTRQAPDLAREFGDFNSATVVRSYMNLDEDPTFLPPARFVIALESLSSWTRIVDSKGKAIFKEAYTIDAAGNRIPDEVDGNLPGGEQSHFGRFKIPVPGATLTADMAMRIKEQDQILSADIRNVREIRAPFVGTVIKPGGFRIVVELYPYRRGFLTYAVSAAKLEQFADRMTPEQLSAQITSIQNWLRSQLDGSSRVMTTSSR